MGSWKSKNLSSFQKGFNYWNSLKKTWPQESKMCNKLPEIQANKKVEFLRMNDKLTRMKHSKANIEVCFLTSKVSCCSPEFVPFHSIELGESRSTLQLSILTKWKLEVHSENSSLGSKSVSWEWIFDGHPCNLSFWSYYSTIFQTLMLLLIVGKKRLWTWWENNQVVKQKSTSLGKSEIMQKNLWNLWNLPKKCILE